MEGGGGIFCRIRSKTMFVVLQQEEEGKKFAKFDDVVKMVQEGLATKDNHGEFNDYMELCKLYDKNENGTMMLAELENILSNLGEPMHSTMYIRVVLAPSIILK